MIERLAAVRDDVEAVAGQVRAMVPPPASVHQAVAGIIASVQEGRDDALLMHERRFGAGDAPLRVGDDELASALDALEPGVRQRDVEVVVGEVDAGDRQIARGARDAPGVGDDLSDTGEGTDPGLGSTVPLESAEDVDPGTTTGDDVDSTVTAPPSGGDQSGFTPVGGTTTPTTPVGSGSENDRNGAATGFTLPSTAGSSSVQPA